MEQVYVLLKDMAFFALTGLMGYVAWDFHQMRKDIQRLNTHIAVIVEKIHNHNNRIANLEVNHKPRKN